MTKRLCPLCHPLQLNVLTFFFLFNQKVSPSLREKALPTYIILESYAIFFFQDSVTVLTHFLTLQLRTSTIVCLLMTIAAVTTESTTATKPMFRAMVTI